MKKNKEGSTLIVTVIIFMFVTTVSLAILSMVSTNYYGRVGESKRTQNLYGSESGLDTTYNIIAKTITAANIYGNEKVQNLQTNVKEMKFSDFYSLRSSSLEEEKDKADLYALYADVDYWKYYQGSATETQEDIDGKKKNGIAKDKEAIYKLTNKVFKSGFKEFINNQTESKLESSINSSSYIELVEEGNSLKQIKQQLSTGDAKVYIGNYPGKNPSEDTKSKIEADKNEMLCPKPPQGEKIINVNESLKIESGYDDLTGKIQYYNHSPNFNLYNEEDYKITVTSEFQTKASEGNIAKVGENLKVIEANYLIRVPNYDEIALKESVENVNPKVNQKISSLVIGGDLDVKDANKLNFNGDIFVQGNEVTGGAMDINNRIINKYSGGIKLNNESSSTQKTINFNNNVYTRGTFNIKNNVNVVVSGNIYAANLYAGVGNNAGNNSRLSANKDVIIDNDLTLKATNTTLNLNNFYGINENNIEQQDTEIGTKVKSSSSIIINDYTKDAENKYGVKINGEAYIMGVAHINTQKGYQTGESIAVKSNYKAYSVPDQTGAEKFEYDDPLQVLQVDDGEENKIGKKENHFLTYWNNNKQYIDCGGVYLNLDNTHSVGAIVYTNNAEKVKVSNYLPADEVKIKSKSREYAENVYQISKNKEYATEVAKNSELDDLYAGRKSSDTVQGLLSKNITDYGVGTGYKINTGDEFAMFSSSNRNIVIKGKGFKGTYTNNDIVIDAQDNIDVNAVIVTNGKVIIDGEVNYKGNIITGGNLEVVKDSIVNISYDEYITQNIQSSNSEWFGKVFDNSFGEEKLNDDILNIESNSTNFLKTKLWKIVQ